MLDVTNIDDNKAISLVLSHREVRRVQFIGCGRSAVLTTIERIFKLSNSQRNLIFKTL